MSISSSEPEEEDIFCDEYDADTHAKDDTNMLSWWLAAARAAPSMVALFAPKSSDGGATAYTSLKCSRPLILHLSVPMILRITQLPSTHSRRGIKKSS
jgi:hypothetical protein